MDRISRLPEPIQHDILNFLQEKEIARAAVLSKAWRSIVHTRPVLVFDQRLFRHKRGSDKLTKIESEDLCFMNRVDEFIKKHDRSIQKFSLVTDLKDTKSWSHYLDRWIQQLVEAKVKVLCLDIKPVYVLPPFVFLSETITNLRLGQCNLGQCGYMRLPNLLELSLRYVTSSQDMIDQISSGCPNLEILRLIDRRGFSSICVSGLARLHEVELSLSGELDVQVVAPMLRVFKIYSWHCSSKSKIDLVGCESTLRNLTLYCVHVTAEGLTGLVSKFIGLEELELDYLGVESIEIPNQKLLELEVSHCSGIERVRIDAPNLRVFRYHDNSLPFYSVNSSFSSNRMIQLYVSVCFFTHDLKELCLKLRGFTHMKLIVRSFHKQEALVCEVLDENVLKMIQDSRTTGMIAHVERITTHQLLVDRLFASGKHWKTISIISGDQQNNRKFLEVLSTETLKAREEEANCCIYKSLKCWRHSLHDTEMIDEETTTTPDLFKSFVAMGYEIARIKLHWTNF